MILVADVGGTNARLDLYDPELPGFSDGTRRSYETADQDGALSLIREYLSDVGAEISSASLAVAAPVRSGTVRLTNLPWSFRPRELAEQLGVPVRLLNDFEAVGHALPHLPDADLAPLQEGEAEAGGVRALIGAGTGLGTAFITGEGGGARVWSSEGGHTEFAARTPVEHRLAAWLRGDGTHVCCERVISGPGIGTIYAFLREEAGAPPPADVRDEVDPEDAPREITHRGLEGSDPLCARTLDVFSSAFGARARDLAVTTWSVGGLYIAGGIAPGMIDFLRDGSFMESFRGSGPMRDTLERMPVRVIRDTYSGLLGAAVAPAAAGVSATGDRVAQ